MATIVEVAGLAGVSTSTVSHVLNGTRHVEPSTRQRVMDAIERTSYRQDALARALRRSRTDSIGLVVSDAGEPAFAQMVHGVEQAAVSLGMTLFLANSAENAERELAAVEALLERRVDGLLLARAATSGPAVVELLRRASTPVVLLDRVYGGLGFDQVAAENVEPMENLVKHLFDQGHRRFGLVVGDTRVPSLAERHEGFRSAVRALGLDPDEQLVAAGEDIAPKLAAALRRPREEIPTAMIAASTVLAVAALSALHDQGLETPRDLAFATFDGFDHPDFFRPRLTTVRQPAFAVGAAAANLLHERMGDAAGPTRTLRLQQRVEYRESTEAYVASHGGTSAA